jgi:hypothetical protein
VKRGAAINRKGWTPLHYACSGPDNGVAAFLIAQGAELNARSENGTTPLMMAARYGNSDLVPLLIKAGAEPRAANEQELTVADFAERGGRDVMAKELRRLIKERQRAAEATRNDTTRAPTSSRPGGRVGKSLTAASALGRLLGRGAAAYSGLIVKHEAYHAVHHPESG